MSLIRSAWILPVLAVVVLAVGLLGVAALSPDAASVGSDGSSSISLTAQSQLLAQPDEAVVIVATDVERDSPSAVRNELSRRTNAVRSALIDMGVEEDNLRTISYTIDERRKEGEIVGYRGRHQLEIRVDPDRSGSVIDTAIGAGATDINSVRFTLSEEREFELRQQVLEDAMERAHTEANTIASSSDLTVSGVHQVQTTNIHYSPIAYERVSADAGGAGGPTQIDAGPITVRAQVHVVFNAS